MEDDENAATLTNLIYMPLAIRFHNFPVYYPNSYFVMSDSLKNMEGLTFD